MLNAEAPRPGGDARPAPEPGRRRDVLAALRAAEAPLSINQIAADLGLHPNTVRFHLDTLVAGGHAERVTVEPAGPGRPPLMFRAPRGMDRTGPRRYELLAGILASGIAAGLDPAGTALRAGRAWGARMVTPASEPGTEPRSLARLMTLLTELGFDPRRRGHHQVGLRHCPFLDLAQSAAAVVCPVHLGLMQGAMTALRSPITVGRLEPFVEPDLCVAHLTATGVAPARSR